MNYILNYVTNYANILDIFESHKNSTYFFSKSIKIYFLKN